ncbi:hypothetical protein QLQ85_14350 [Halomonas sp. M4R5S39]|uniref:Phosphatidate cytidylyltransferase n=1 Tax=Halomonas kalidii TaxID=3043293 RepID=A0ABT6VLU1_9GAMM|nr:hypothetical protein [Halomonas kalidii]MDI5934630.1 hypothetical protein [Halomonas kalidii]MDI5985975.1 hypothetical protein [Halomonas kalidii]
MTDKVLAIVALLGLIAFLITVPLFVPHIDLIIFTVMCVLLAAFDFWRELFRGKR